PSNFHIDPGIAKTVVHEVGGKRGSHKGSQGINADRTAPYTRMTSTACATIVAYRFLVCSQIRPQINPSTRAIQCNSRKVLTMKGSKENESVLARSAAGERRRSDAWRQMPDSIATSRPNTKPRKLNSTNSAIPPMNHGIMTTTGT